MAIKERKNYKERIYEKLSPRASRIIKSTLDQLASSDEKKYVRMQILHDIEEIIKYSNMTRKIIETPELARSLIDKAYERRKNGNSITANGLISICMQLEEWVNSYKPRVIDGRKSLAYAVSQN